MPTSGVSTAATAQGITRSLRHDIIIGAMAPGQV